MIIIIIISTIRGNIIISCNYYQITIIYFQYIIVSVLIAKIC